MAPLGSAFPNLILADALYFNEPFAKAILARGADFLFKCFTEADFRTVLSDAQFRTGVAKSLGHGENHVSGYDDERMCSYDIEASRVVYAGVTVIAAHVVERYDKDKRRPVAEFWVLTSRLSLSLEGMRQAAHARWHIENDVFKRLSHLAGTKRFRLKNPTAFLSLLLLVSAAVGALDAFFSTVRQDVGHFKVFLGGMKPTWLNLFAALRYAKDGLAALGV